MECVGSFYVHEHVCVYCVWVSTTLKLPLSGHPTPTTSRHIVHLAQVCACIMHLLNVPAATKEYRAVSVGLIQNSLEFHDLINSLDKPNRTSRFDEAADIVSALKRGGWQ